MEIHNSGIIRHPLETVYACYRDDLPKIAHYLSTISKIETESREETPDGPKLHNIWYAVGKIPKVATAIIKPEMLMWDDLAQWFDAQHYAEWELKTRFFQQNVKCFGKSNFYYEDASSTRIELSGELNISLQGIPGIPKILHKRVEPQIERFIVAMIAPSLKNVTRGIQLYLDDCT